jgi:hypothetical protein
MQRYNTTLGYTEVYNGTTWLGVAVQNSSNNLLMNSGYGSDAVAYGCRAWVNFNGTGTVAIRASGNVSSITDGGTGMYTINFTTAMPDANYCVIGTSGGPNGSSGDDSVVTFGAVPSSTSSTPIIRFRNFTDNLFYDVQYGAIAVFR